MNDIASSAESAKQTTVQPYRAPRLIHYGDVRTLTQNGSAGGPETTPACSGPAGQPAKLIPCGSDRRLKTNIVEVGRHPSGFGLYWFDYLPEYTSEFGEGRQFGVMADEVRTVHPEAVVADPRGFLAVRYDLLGINRPTVH